MSLSPRLARLMIGILALLHAWLAWSVSSHLSCTYDEPAHIGAGHAYWQTGDKRLHPENGLLPQLWCALPMQFGQGVPSSFISEERWAKADVWAFGGAVLFDGTQAPDIILSSARGMNALLGAVLVLAIGLFALKLAGVPAGLLAAALCAASPTFLAHAGLATSDTAGALGFTLAAGAWWALCHRVSAGRVLGAGLALGFLCLAKFSALLFAPMAVAMIIARLARRSDLPAAWPFPSRLKGVRRVPALLAGAAGAALITWVCIWGAYGFRFEAAGPTAPPTARFAYTWEDTLLVAPTSFQITSVDGQTHEEVVHTRAGVVQHAVGWAKDQRLLPEAWLHGLAFVARHSYFRRSYFAGEWRSTGWKTFFPLAYVLKSTPAELAAHLLGVAALGALAWRGAGWGRSRAYRATPWLIVVAVYGAFAVSASLNIGHRHLLPAYAAGAALAGFTLVKRPRSAPHGRTWARMSLVAGALLLGQTSAALRARPDYLAYFNPLAGSRPDQWFVDSSLDWGQSLPELASWLERRDDSAPVHLSYFGNDRPKRFGIRAVRFGDAAFDSDPFRPGAAPLSGGWYVFSATMWRRVYTGVRGPWRPSYEETYQQARAWLQRLNASAKEGAPLVVYHPDVLAEKIRAFDEMRLGRLVHFLQTRPPDARIGRGFIAYRISEEELGRMLRGPL